MGNVHDYQWIAQIQISTIQQFIEAHALLDDSGLQFTFEQKEGVILSADTYSVDQILRYLVIGKSLQSAEYILKKWKQHINLMQKDRQPCFTPM